LFIILKLFFLFSLFTFGLTSCKIAAPTFKNIGQWQVSKISGTEVTLSNTAYFYNPNNVDGIKVNGISLELQTGGKKLGTITSTGLTTAIPKLSDFQVPLSFSVNLSDLIGNISDIISIATGKSIDLRCIGNVNVGYSVISKSIKIDQTVPVNLKDIKKTF
jgi:hypothetical protein